MAIRSILTQVHPAPRGVERLEFAASLAKSLGAYLIGVGVQDFSPYIASTGAFGYVDAGAVQAIRDEVEREIADAGDLFHKTKARLQLDGEWHTAVADPVETMARLSRSADLIIASRRDTAEGPVLTALPSDLLVESGRPVLVTPPHSRPLEARSVLVAWKDGKEARRALSDAMPFLERAERVLVAEVCHADEADDAALRTSAVVRHLHRHGIKAEAQVSRIGHGKIAPHLVDLVNQIGADLLVAGAYAHPRLREWVFGGVTQELLEGSPVACLLSH
jgi:nucleotide-binding universal stress UspA family protein